MSEQKGVWRTICGRKVFIAEGQTLQEAMKASGKFTDKVIDAVGKNETDESKKKQTDEQMTEEQLAEFLGEEFEGVKGQAAVEKLIQEKRGHVKGAFVREDIGAIDLFWGNGDVGLQHILDRREEQGIDTAEFVKGMTEVVEQGTFGGPAKAKDSFIFRTKDKSAVIAYTFKSNDVQYVLSSFLSHGGGKGKKKPPQ